MLNCFSENIQNITKLIPIKPIIQNGFTKWLEQQSEFVKNLVKMNGFSAQSASICLISNKNGELDQVLLGMNDQDDFWAFGVLPLSLPCEDVYNIDTAEFSQGQLEKASIAWGLGSYCFVKYKKDINENPKLFISKICNKNHIVNIVSSVCLVRDLINTPAEDMNPVILAQAASNIAKKYDAKFKQIVGDDLLQNNFPGVHVVGRASIHSPRLIEFQWGDVNHPKITLVGKGICFDSGGLDLKPASGMELMKKDMGGAAHALGLAQMIMTAKLPINLRVIIPIAENLVSGSSYKPGDVVKMRNGITVEITNTDAEGRVILADVLTYACEDKPDLLIDFATLTGAARIALGTELQAMFTNDCKIGEQIFNSCYEVDDQVWHLPLYAQYKELLDSKIADMKNCAASSYGGAITAALFLQEFVAKEIKWIHFDIMGANIKTKPGRPEGGEAMSIRGLFSYLHEKYNQ